MIRTTSNPCQSLSQHTSPLSDCSRQVRTQGTWRLKLDHGALAVGYGAVSGMKHLSHLSCCSRQVCSQEPDEQSWNMTSINTVVYNIDAQSRVGASSEVARLMVRMEMDGCEGDVVTYSTGRRGFRASASTVTRQGMFLTELVTVSVLPHL